MRLLSPVLLLAVAVFAVSAGADPQPPTTEVPAKSCVTADCHAGVKGHKVLHGPVNVNACDACHQLVDASKHRYKLTRKPNELCTSCHVTDMAKAKVVHKPLKTGDCAGCHDPHGGFDKNFLKSRSMKQLCKSCHEDVTGGGKHVHGPVAAGACGACHQPHTSDNEHLLTLTGRSLCISCHKEMGEQLDRARVVHEPVKNDCQSCHDAHASDSPKMLAGEPMKLCTGSCHESVRKTVTEATHRHSAVTEKRACVNCHTAHGGELAHLVKAQPMKLCLECHSKPVEAEGHTVASVADMTRKDLYKHGPLRDGACGGCHNVHGSDVSRLLTKPYTVDFYESYKAEKYALCFECHDAKLVATPRTEGLTNFRNGDLNLHYLHVNKQKRGRSCRACHTTHASKFPVNIRESVPYGNWALPIGFKMNDDGGSCAPGCHQQLGYSRTTPIDYNAAEEPPAPADAADAPDAPDAQPEAQPEPDAPAAPTEPAAPRPDSEDTEP